MIKLGVNSVLFGGFDFPTAARHIAMAGYDGIELSAIKGMCEHLVLDRWREQVDAIRKTTADNKLALLSMEVTSLEDDRAIPGIEAAQALGIPVVNFGPGGKSKNKEDLDRQAGIIARLAEIAARHGVTLCVKAHVGACVDDTPTTQELMKRVQGPGFGVDMDPSHVYRAGEDPAKALSSVIQRVRHIHIRDCKGKGPGPGTPPDQACGRGDIDLGAFCKVMADAGYDGPVCLEVIGAGQMELAQVSVIAAESYGYLNAVLKRLGKR
ncbi:MAG TPA: sugar phosphate isomerase/epimerase [Spirochaetia bacterium]|nr:sugar phosphate isomerase/epimerase [Spirochaetia bacterium]